MSDLQILALSRLAQAATIITELTKAPHTFPITSCDHCAARLACRAIVDIDANQDYYTNYRAWAQRTPLLSLSDLQQQHPELLI